MSFAYTQRITRSARKGTASQAPANPADDRDPAVPALEQVRGASEEQDVNVLGDHQAVVLVEPEPRHDRRDRARVGGAEAVTNRSASSGHAALSSSRSTRSA
jgi:hypothetical protein